VHTGENTRATRIVTRTSNRLSIVFVSTFSITMFLLEPPRYFSWENESARNKLLNSKDSSKKRIETSFKQFDRGLISVKYKIVSRLHSYHYKIWK
jgi:hypothetical protein